MRDEAVAAPGATATSAGDPLPVDAARVLTRVGALAAGEAPGTGALWRLAEPGRQLDANVIRLVPRQVVERHVEPDLDVLLLVTGGDGVLHGEEGSQRLDQGTLLWLPHGSSRSLHAGDDGLVYLTVHRRRPGMQIRRRAPGA